MKQLTYKGLVVGLLLATFFSCSKKIDEVYQNPNADVRVKPEELLPQIISSMAANYGGHGPASDIRYVGSYIQSFSWYLTQSNFDRMGYINGLADIAQSTWRMHYFDIGQNNQRMIQWALEEEKWDYAGVGKAIEAWSWLTLTDYYDNVILDEAFNTNKITFKYNTQPEVYAYIKKLSFDALDLLNRTGGAVSQANLAIGDAYFFNGDVNKWKKFVYGNLARVHNRYSNKASLYKPDSVIYYANLAMQDNADNAMVRFEASTLTATHNYFSSLRGNITGAAATNPTAIRQGEYVANLLNGTNSAFSGVQDPRAIYLLRLNTNNTFKGVPIIRGQASMAANDRPENFYGVSQAGAASNAATPSPQGPRYLFRSEAPFPVMTAAEMHFLKAEAYFRTNKTAALASYREGIRQNLEMLRTVYSVNVPAAMLLTQPIIDAHLANPAVVPANANDLTLSKIMLQKYIALYVFGALETWVDMRRYHYVDPDPSGTGKVYADFTPPTGGDLFQDNNGELIYRYYPRFNSEYVWNINELNRIGATKLNYHANPAEKIWFALP